MKLTQTPICPPKKEDASPFDNLFLTLASENRIALIVSGDRHLLDLKSFAHIQIVIPSEGVQIIMKL